MFILFSDVYIYFLFSCFLPIFYSFFCNYFNLFYALFFILIYCFFSWNCNVRNVCHDYSFINNNLPSVIHIWIFYFLFRANFFLFGWFLGLFDFFSWCVHVFIYFCCCCCFSSCRRLLALLLFCNFCLFPLILFVASCLVAGSDIWIKAWFYLICFVFWFCFLGDMIICLILIYEIGVYVIPLFVVFYLTVCVCVVVVCCCAFLPLKNFIVCDLGASTI